MTRTLIPSRLICTLITIFRAKEVNNLTLDADIVAYAIGQLPTSPIREVVCANEKILKDAGIFFAGDVVAPRNIGTAMREGKARAREIEEWLLKRAPKKVFPVPMTVKLVNQTINGKC